MIPWLKTFGQTHIVYVIVISLGLVAFHSWLAEHDARLLADQQVKTSEAKVKATEDEIADLKQEITDNDARAAQQIEAVQKLVQSVKTPQQVVTKLPEVAPNLPVSPTVQSDNSISFPKEDVLPLFQDLANGKEAAVKLDQCQTDYAAQKQIDVKKDSQLKDKDDEITALKKPKGFWRRFGNTLKTIGIGVAVGYAGAHV